MSFSDLGTSLVERRRRLDMQEAGWFAALVEFDRRGEWASDGHLSCVSWLVHFCGMARATAKEKLRVAWQLARRPLLAEAHAGGQLSYSKVRALTRVVDGSEETDRALLAAAAVGTAAQLEQLARHFELLADQEHPAEAMARFERRGVRRAGTWDGMATTEVVLPVEDDQRLHNMLDGYVERCRRGRAGPVEKVSAEAAVEARPRLSFSQARADALVDLLEAGLAHLEQGGLIDPEVAAIGVLCDYDTLCRYAPGTAQLGNGVPLSGEAARRLACDAGLCRIITRGKSEVLDVGRQTREWNRAQRRAIRYRHGGRCAFPGCDGTITQIHHCTPWADTGRTDLDAGVPVCWGHHRLVHEGGWAVHYDGPTGTTIFTAPDGHQVIARAGAGVPSAA